VDDADHPAAALMWDQGGYYFLLGDAHDMRFNSALGRLIAEEVAPQAVARGFGAFKVDYSSDSWAERVPGIFGTASLVERERVCLALDRPRLTDWAARIPDGYQLRRVDSALLAGLDPASRAALTGEIACCWRSIEDFLGQGFGFCVVRGEELVAWSTAEYVSGRDTGIGIETKEEYRGRGFATATAAAFIDHCLAHGLTPYWDSWRGNAPSVAVAGKVGFRELLRYTVHLGRFE
jgi:RimJ/RimL family protein N-acetyltransferase